MNEWIALLESKRAADVLSALVFLGGRHMVETERRFVDKKDGLYATLFEETILDANIRALISRHTKSPSRWIREAAALASRGPRDRPIDNR